MLVANATTAIIIASGKTSNVRENSGGAGLGIPFGIFPTIAMSYFLSNCAKYVTTVPVIILKNFMI